MIKHKLKNKVPKNLIQIKVFGHYRTVAKEYAMRKGWLV